MVVGSEYVVQKLWGVLGIQTSLGDESNSLLSGMNLRHFVRVRCGSILESPMPVQGYMETGIAT